MHHNNNSVVFKAIIMPKQAISKDKIGKRNGEVDLRLYLNRMKQKSNDEDIQPEPSKHGEIVEGVQPKQRQETQRKIKSLKKDLKKVKNNIKRLLRANLNKDEEISFLTTQIMRHTQE